MKILVLERSGSSHAIHGRIASWCKVEELPVDSFAVSDVLRLACGSDVQLEV